MKNLKKFFIGFMTLAFVASADVNSSSADTSTYLKGDVNNNNQLDTEFRFFRYTSTI